MEYRILGDTGLKVPVLTLGTATFGGGTEFFKAWGTTDVAEASRMVDLCLDAGVNMFDTADAYSMGMSEEILGKAIEGRRDEVLISTKANSRTGPGENDLGSSRYHLIRLCEASLRRLGTDHVELYYLHAFDNMTAIEETLRAMEDLVRSGKVFYIGCSNFAAWQLMKSLGISEKYGMPRHVAHQVSYSLLGRDVEWELIPLGMDQKVSTMPWSPLASGRLTGKVRREQAVPEDSRVAKLSGQGTRELKTSEVLYDVVDALVEVAEEVGKTVSQVALNWLLQRPTVTSIVFGARTEEQLLDNLGAAGWNLAPEQVAKLNAASDRPLPYPYSHQRLRRWPGAQPEAALARVNCTQAGDSGLSASVATRPVVSIFGGSSVQLVGASGSGVTVGVAWGLLTGEPGVASGGGGVGSSGVAVGKGSSGVPVASGSGVAVGDASGSGVAVGEGSAGVPETSGFGVRAVLHHRIVGCRRGIARRRLRRRVAVLG